MANDLFKWEPRYQLNVKSMDDEHMVLIDLMNGLFKKYEGKAPFKEQNEALGKLAEYTIKHFTDEEAYMASVNFPGLETHKVIHKALLTKVTEFVVEAQKKESINPELFNFLKTWLAAHIMGIDTKYSEHANKKSA